MENKHKNILITALTITGILFSFSAYGESDEVIKEFISAANQGYSSNTTNRTFRELLYPVAKKNNSFSPNSSPVIYLSSDDIAAIDALSETQEDERGRFRRLYDWAKGKLGEVKEVVVDTGRYAYDYIFGEDEPTSYITIVVNETIMPGINPSLEQYMADLKREGYIPTIVDDRNFKTPEQLRNYFKQEYEKGELNGVLLVGDLPVAKHNYFFTLPSSYALNELFTAKDKLNERADKFNNIYSKRSFEEWKKLKQLDSLNTYERYRILLNITTQEERKFLGELVISDSEVIYVPLKVAKNDFEKILVRNMQNGNVTLFLEEDKNNTFDSLFSEIYSKEEIDEWKKRLPSNAFPLDLYYTDLNGEWRDLDRDGILDMHIAGEGNQIPEIYLGRLTASPFANDKIKNENIIIPATTTTIRDKEGHTTVITTPERYKYDYEYNSTKEIEILNEYFARNHDFRTGESERSNKALVFVDDDWWEGAKDEDNRVGLVYNLTIMNEFNETNASNYLKQLQTENYDWVSLAAHSGPQTHFFANKEKTDIFPSSELSETKPYFYNLFSCSVADYSKDNYIAGQYIFGENNNGLATIGSTNPGGMTFSESFYESLEKGNNLGEAFKDWQISRGPTYDLDKQNWDYGMTILGDPTLVLHPKE